MSYDIIETVTDLAGNKRVQVRISDSQTLILKFKQDPTQQQVDSAVEAFLSSPIEPPPEPIIEEPEEIS